MCLVLFYIMSNNENVCCLLFASFHFSIISATGLATYRLPLRMHDFANASQEWTKWTWKEYYDDARRLAKAFIKPPSSNGFGWFEPWSTAQVGSTTNYLVGRAWFGSMWRSKVGGGTVRQRHHLRFQWALDEFYIRDLWFIRRII